MAQYLRISKVVRSFYESISYSDKVSFKVVSWIFFIMHREYGTVVFFVAKFYQKRSKMAEKEQQLYLWFLSKFGYNN